MENFGINGDYQKKLDNLKGSQDIDKSQKTEEMNIFEDFFKVKEPTSQQRHAIISEAEKALENTELERFREKVEMNGLKDEKKALEKAFKRIENPTDSQKAQHEKQLNDIEDKIELGQLRYDAFLADSSEDPVIQNFNLKLNNMTGQFMNIAELTEKQTEEISAIFQGVLEEYIAELNENGIEVTDTISETLQGQLAKAQNLIEMTYLKSQMSSVKNSFRLIENPSDEQKLQQETIIKELESQYAERKELFSR